MLTAKAEQALALGAKLTKTRDLLQEWLDAYEGTGGDNGPGSLVEYDIAQRVRTILAILADS